jgi:hypothetical protein
MTMNKNLSSQGLQESEILAEFQAEDMELARELIGLRQAPRAELQRRIAQIPHGSADRLRATPLLQRRLRAVAIWTTAVVMLLVALLFAFPGLRAAAAQAVAHIWESLRFGMSGAADGPVTFSPAPPFDVYQPDYLPQEFALTVQFYQPQTEPGAATSSLMQEVLENVESGASSSGLGPELIAAHQIDEPHIVLFYEAGDGRYALLLEREAHPGEGQPAGEALEVINQPAVLQRDGESLILFWIQEATWLTLEGPLTEDELLRVAESMVMTQTAGERGEESLVEGAGASVEPPPFCNPDDRPPPGLLLGVVQDQQYWGSVWIHLLDRERFPESVGHGISLGSVTPAMLFERALEALQALGLNMTPLSYPSLGHFTTSDDDVPCWWPDPRLQGYIAIEIWDEQVNVGFGGDGAVLKGRAVQALEQELDSVLR